MFRQPDDPGVDPDLPPLKRDLSGTAIFAGAAIALLILYALILGV